MKTSIKALLMTGCAIGMTAISLSQAFAAKKFAPINWESSNSQDVVAIHAPGNSIYNVLISVDRAVMGIEKENINVNCEDQTFVVKPGSAIICQFGNQPGFKPTVTFSSISNRATSGSYQVE